MNCADCMKEAWFFYATCKGCDSANHYGQPNLPEFNILPPFKHLPTYQELFPEQLEAEKLVEEMPDSIIIETELNSIKAEMKWLRQKLQERKRRRDNL